MSSDETFGKFQFNLVFNSSTYNLIRKWNVLNCLVFSMFVGPDEPFIYSHPKLEKLEEVVVQHFRQWAESAEDSNGEESSALIG